MLDADQMPNAWEPIVASADLDGRPDEEEPDVPPPPHI